MKFQCKPTFKDGVRQYREVCSSILLPICFFFIFKRKKEIFQKKNNDKKNYFPETLPEKR